MKCQNCGKSEVNFHYSSNINGCVTETYLCSECAAKTGYDIGSMFSTGSIFDSFFPIISVPGQFLTMPMAGFGMAIPLVIQPPADAQTQPVDYSRGCGCERIAPDAPAAEVDDEMRKRREINVLREQMRLAAESDDFEKAIELRDRIKEMDV